MKHGIMSRKKDALTKVQVALIIGVVVVAAVVGAYAYNIWTTPKIVELTWWCRDYHEDVAREYANDFMEKHPNIKINIEACTWTGLFEKVTTALVGGSPPDIIVTNLAGWIPAFADYLLPLDKYIERDKEELNMSDWMPRAWELSTWDPVAKKFGQGHTYVVAWRFDGQCLFWNLDAFEEVGLDPLKPPQNWDELLEYAKRLTIDRDGDGKIDQYGLGMMGTPNVNFVLEAGFVPYMWTHGSTLISEDLTTCLINTSVGIEAAEYYLKLKPYTQPEVLSTKWSDLGPLMAKGVVAMFIDHIANFETIKKMTPTMRVGVTKYPGGPKGQWSPVVAVGWAIPKASKHPDEAWEFIKYISAPERVARITNGVPPRYSSLKHPKFDMYREASYTEYGLLGGSDTARPDPAHYLSNYGEIFDIAGRCIAEIWQGADVKKTLDACAAEINKTLKK